MTNDVTTTTPTWREIGRKKREQVRASLPTQWCLSNVPSAQEEPNALAFSRTHLSAREIEITEHYSASQLLQLLANGSLSATEVLEAFAHRATIAHQLTNCLSEVFFDEAKAQAQRLDQYYAEHGKPIGPLHGLPVSLKDQFRVKGVETSLGYISWLGKVETEESESWLVSRLREMGAVLYCKTNVPSSLMAIETNNNIIGYTTNAHNRLLSSGGSSGGEAALLAMRGSILGLGSDVGASIRQPSAYNGIVGIKPTSTRFPYLGIANSMEGQTIVRSSIGVMGHTIPDLRLLTKTILSLEPWNSDPNVVPIPWRQEMETQIRDKIREKNLVFGVIRNDGIVTPHPPILRAVDETVAALKANGYKVIEISPPSHSEAFQILWNTFAADGGTEIHSTLTQSGEPPVPELAISYGEKLGHLPPTPLNETWTLTTQKHAYETRYAAFWRAHDLDAIICPAAPTLSHRPGEGRYFGYTGVWNVLDYSAVTVRSGRRAEKEGDDGKIKTKEGLDGEVMGQYDPELFDGMPIGLQVVCRKFEEEKVLAIAEEVETILLGKD
ncbi:uncharacterized protein MYCFIDRAFT_54362 [Pseudocercospora fijiensis CIRAD86]|uniref:amidase n=1 Tax=Pseudocercospora fijiensis (strain CIRAD86) TaxID=383855 RepID=M3B7B6_PSEFD|nr:uncharacterized protein MYCFIDRAFT_54362 [Pseudocercospora fijiensis CIRAD86]EME85207.1 hypothetical protein MYCFIDRAFT_54362 [Pseudocercospora fijiensis CIRAD86]